MSDEGFSGSENLHELDEIGQNVGITRLKSTLSVVLIAEDFKDRCVQNFTLKNLGEDEGAISLLSPLCTVKYI